MEIYFVFGLRIVLLLLLSILVIHILKWYKLIKISTVTNKKCIYLCTNYKCAKYEKSINSSVVK